jgi:hypothetical protein
MVSKQVENIKKKKNLNKLDIIFTDNYGHVGHDCTSLDNRVANQIQRKPKIQR